jgi:hypothetical protein
MCELADYRARRENNRLCAAVRQAALHATPGELVDLERMIVLVRNGNLTTDQAVSTCASIRRNADRSAA